MRRVVVTGAAGFIGSHLVDRLLERGHEVVGVDAFTGYYPRVLKERNLSPAMGCEGYRLVEGDLLEIDLDGLLDGADAVAHLAGEPGVRRSWGDGFARYLDRNVRSTQRLLESAGRLGIERFVYASSSSVYGPDAGRPLREEDPRRPASPYGLSKLAGEELVGLYSRERGVPGTVLRYFTVYGPRQRPEMALARFIKAARLGRRVEIFGDGEQRRDLTHVYEAVDATVAALGPGAPTGVFNVGGGARASVNEMLDAVRLVTGRPVETVYGPEAAGDARSTWADSTRASRALGYRPRVSLEDGVAEQAAWEASVASLAASAP